MHKGKSNIFIAIDDCWTKIIVTTNSDELTHVPESVECPTLMGVEVDLTLVWLDLLCQSLFESGEAYS
jgi:hypothetical protein